MGGLEMGFYRYTHVREKGGQPATRYPPHPLVIQRNYHPYIADRGSPHRTDDKGDSPKYSRQLYTVLCFCPITTDNGHVTPSRNFPKQSQTIRNPDKKARRSPEPNPYIFRWVNLIELFKLTRARTRYNAPWCAIFPYLAIAGPFYISRISCISPIFPAPFSPVEISYWLS